MFDEAIDRLRLQLGKISETEKTAETPTPLHRRKSAKTGKRSASSKLAQKRNERRTQSLKRRAASPASLRQPVAERLDMFGGIVMWRPLARPGNRNAIRVDKLPNKLGHRLIKGRKKR